MFKVLSFGEALVDLWSNNISEKEQVDAPESFTKFLGGTPANVAAAVSHLGGNAFFTGMLGKDLLGDLIAHSPAEEGVNLDFLNLTNEAKTGLAFVALDVQRECSFEFYQQPLVSFSTPPQSVPCLQPSAPFASRK